MAPQFTVRFDTRTKEVIISALKKELSIAEELITNGDYSKESLIRYEELNRVIRGILFVKPDEATNE